MASNACLALLLILSTVLVANAGDPDITTDFLLPEGTKLDVNFFTFKGLRGALWSAPKDAPVKVTPVSLEEFPALNGQSTSLAVVQYAAGAFIPPHFHPRASEIFLVLQGSLTVGVIDSNNKLFTQVLFVGDSFLFPKGLVHFQVNDDAKYPAVTISTFGSVNPGTTILPTALFGSGIDKEVLAKSFNTDAHTINKLVFANTMG